MIFNQSAFEVELHYYERFNELLNVASHLQNVCEEGEVFMLGFTQLVGDIWLCFYAEAPGTFTLTQQKSKFSPFIQQLLQQDNYNSWHPFTKLDPLLSILTTIMICEQLLQQLKNDEKTKADAIKRKVAQNKITHAANKLEQLALSDESNFKRDQNKFTSQSAMRIIQKTEQELIEMNDSSHSVLQKFSNTLSFVLQQTNEQVLKQKEAIVAFSTIDGKKITNVPLRDQFQIAEQLAMHETLQKVAEMAGRFKRIAKKKMKTPSIDTMERKNISLGNEITRLLPFELANYIISQSKSNFLKRYAESQLFTFDKKGKESKGKGPIIICMDESSSMMSIKAESKAFCLALLMIAKKQRRDFAIIPFASNVGEIQFFYKGQATTDQLLQFSQNFLGGGTNFEKPLRESLNILLKSRFNEADILFVTDGSSFLTTNFIEEFISTKKKKKFECTSIVLTNLFNAVDLRVVNRFSDHVIEVNNLFEAEGVFSLQ